MNDFKKTIKGLKLSHKLKEIKRKGEVGNRQETTAEHVYSSLILLEYFLKIIPNINVEKVRKMTLYHDSVEIYSGDFLF